MVETTSWLIIPAFIVGAIFSGLAGNIGMRIATEVNNKYFEIMNVLKLIDLISIDERH